MREIKFRAFCKRSKEMFPVLAWYRDEDMIQTDSDECSVYNTCNFHIMQYTGLTTRAGVKLYEGDICTQKRLGKDVVFEIIFRWGMFMAKIGPVEFVLKTACENDYNHNLPIKVIGNIYENPEFLKAKDE